MERNNQTDTSDNQPSENLAISYYQNRMNLLGITNTNNTIRVFTKDGKPVDYHFFKELPEGIQINYFTPDGKIHYYDRNGKLVEFYRKRIAAAINGNKYWQPPKSGIVPFITPSIIKKYRKREQIITLFIVEGEFKAFCGDMIDLNIIGIGGIHNFKDKEENDLHCYIKDIIRLCQVKNIVFLTDADVLDVNYKEGEDLSKRLNSFCSALINFNELCKPLNVEVYFAHINIEHKKDTKGLDDLIIHHKTDKRQLIKELNDLTVGKKRKYITCLNISDNNSYKLRQYFGINSVDVFYEKYRDIIDDKEFYFQRNKYFFDGKKLKVSWYGEANQYLRVGVDYYKISYTKNSHGKIEITLTLWNISAIIRDYGNNREFVKQIPKFDLFCNIPDNTPAYQRIHEAEINGIVTRLYNRYSPIEYIPMPGEFATIEKFLKHIFSSTNLKNENLYEFGLDYLQLLYTNPTQRLPVLCLVSKIRNTGKSTFLDFLRLIFGENMVILDNERIQGKFTSHYIDKLVIGVDESFIDVNKKEIKERIKNFSTGRKQWLEAKGQHAQELDFFGKQILCSNDETNFMQIDDGENRFCVLKIPALAFDDPHILEKMQKEIPAFLYFLSNRKLKYAEEKSRFHFDSEVYKTEAAQNVIERTKPTPEKEIDEFIKEELIKYKYSELLYCPKDIALEINKNTSFKISPTYVRDYLKYTKNLKTEKLQRYKLYQVDMGYDNSEIVTIRDNKSGTPYKFSYKDWLTQEEISAADVSFTKNEDDENK